MSVYGLTQSETNC